MAKSRSSKKSMLSFLNIFGKSKKRSATRKNRKSRKTRKHRKSRRHMKGGWGGAPNPVIPQTQINNMN